MTLFFEIIFTLSITFKFLTTFIEEGENNPETSHLLIAENYKDNGGLFNDILTWLPIVFLVDCSRTKFFRCFYLIKSIRFKKAIDSINIAAFM